NARSGGSMRSLQDIRRSLSKAAGRAVPRRARSSADASFALQTTCRGKPRYKWPALRRESSRDVLRSFAWRVIINAFSGTRHGTHTVHFFREVKNESKSVGLGRRKRPILEA